MPPSMSSVKYILATKSSFLSSSWMGWWTPGDSFRTDGSRWSCGGGRHHFTVLLPRSSFLVSFLPSFFYVATLYENEKATSYQIESPSAILFSVLDRYAPSYRLFLVCFISMSPWLFPRGINALSWFALVGEYGRKTWFRVMSWLKE